MNLVSSQCQLVHLAVEEAPAKSCLLRACSQRARRALECAVSTTDRLLLFFTSFLVDVAGDQSPESFDRWRASRRAS